MNHAKLETYYRIFDASIVPVCAGGCARLTEALAARLGRKVTDTARGAGAPRSAKAHPTGVRFPRVNAHAAAGFTHDHAVSGRSRSSRWSWFELLARRGAQQ